MIVPDEIIRAALVYELRDLEERIADARSARGGLRSQPGLQQSKIGATADRKTARQIDAQLEVYRARRKEIKARLWGEAGSE